jgi:hypothetical protein
MGADVDFGAVIGTIYEFGIESPLSQLQSQI